MFYAKFEELCRLNGKKISEVYRELNIPQSTVSSWKARGITPSNKTLLMISEYFGVSPSYLATDPDGYVTTKTKCCICSIECAGLDNSLALCIDCYKKSIAALTTIDNISAELSEFSNKFN